MSPDPHSPVPPTPPLPAPAPAHPDPLPESDYLMRCKSGVWSLYRHGRAVVRTRDEARCRRELIGRALLLATLRGATARTLVIEPDGSYELTTFEPDGFLDLAIEEAEGGESC